MAETFRLFGNLFLEEPGNYLGELAVGHLLALLPYFQDLERRTQSNGDEIGVRVTSGAIIKTNPTPLDLFTDFAHKEIDLWQPSRREDELVPPSGKFESPIAHHLHNPSFHTLNPHDGETADPTNLCIHLVMDNGFVKGETFIFDHLHRREIVDGIRKYPASILAHHEAYTAQLRSNMKATVEVVWGKIVRTRMLQIYHKKGNALEALQLWGGYQQVTLFLEWDEPSDNPGRKLVRFIIFVAHPQVFLTPAWSKFAVAQDLSLAVAGKLARVEMKAGYYQKNPQTTKKNFVSRAAYEKAPELGQKALEAVLLSNGVTPKTDTRISKPRTTTETAREQAELNLILDSAGQESNRLSTNRLKDLLRDSLDLIKREELFLWDETEETKYLPKEIQAWLHDHMKDLQPGSVVTSAAEIQSAFEAATTRRMSLVTPTELIHVMLRFHQETLGDTEKRLKIDEDTFSPIFGQRKKMKRKCECCDRLVPPDERPRYNVQNGRYVVREYPCNTVRRHAVPYDADINYVYPNQGSRNAKAAKNDSTRAARTLLIRSKEDSDHLPSKIQTRCDKCNEEVTDDQASWSTAEPSRYVAQRKKCKACGVQTRFVPTNPDLQFNYKKTLADLERDNVGMDSTALTSLLSVRFPTKAWSTSSYC